MQIPVTPLIWIERLSAGTSNQPQRRLRPRHGAELAALLRHLVARRAGRFDVQLARERPAADARAIGLGDAEHVVQHARADAGAGGSLAGDAVRRGDEGIGAVVDVEQRALRAFEEQVAARLVDGIQGVRNVDDHRLDHLGVGHRLREDGFVIDGLRLEVLRQHEVVIIDVLLQLLREALRIEQVIDAQRAGARPCPRRPGQCPCRLCRCACRRT